METVTNSNDTNTYGYDNLYRLTSESITDSINGDYSASYQYDMVGNRTYETVDGVQTAYTYDNNDRLTQQGGTTYTYDDNGNTLTEALDGNVKTYQWDGKNKLISLDNVGVVTGYTYNFNGVRTSKTEGGFTTDFIVDENRDYAQVLQEIGVANDPAETESVQVKYNYGHDLISQERNSEANFYHYDGLGSTRQLSDEAGAITDSYNYEAFGEVLNQTGSTENSYLFTGEQFDSSLNQYYLRARYYDQSVGRFTQMDTWYGKACTPITLNKYVYGNADPVSHTDPSGNISLSGLMSAMNVRAVLSTTAQGVRTAGFSYTRQRGGRSITKAVTCQIGASYIKRSYANDLVHGHHPINRSFGGANDQALIFLPANTHRMFHYVLDIVLRDIPELGGRGNWTSARNWDVISQSRAGRRLLYNAVFTASQAVDRFCDLPRGRRISTFVRINRDRFIGGQ